MTRPTDAEVRDRYEPRHVHGGMPTDCCEFGVIDMDRGGIELCRCWTADDARRISAAMNAAAGRKNAAIANCFRAALTAQETQNDRT